MLKKVIEFDNLDGDKVRDEFYFNYSKPELLEMELTEDGSMIRRIRRLQEIQDAHEALMLFKYIVEHAIGRRSEDNRVFEKSPEISRRFMQCDAYSVLLFDLATDAEAGAEFIKAIMPKEFLTKEAQDKILHEVDKNRVQTVLDVHRGPERTEVVELPKTKELADYTDAELIDLTHAELTQLMRRHKGTVPKGVLLLAMQKANAEK